MKYTKAILVIATLFLSSISNAQVWSPDGKKIAFFYIHSIEDIYTVNADGSDFKILEGHPERDFGPCWSPDGKHILFTSVRDGHHELYRFNAKGKKLKKLTNTAFNSEDGSYSPDGKSIVFTSDRDGNNDIYVMNSDGSNVRRLTSTNEIETSPRWSPTGDQILYRRQDHKEAPTDLYTIELDNKKVKRLTKSDEGEFHATWSRDATKICYVTVKDGAFRIHAMNIESGSSKIILNTPGYQAFFPNWSPDGTEIAFTRDVMEGTKPGLPALFKIDMKGNETLLSDKNSF